MQDLEQDRCARCQRHEPVEGGELCDGCRAFLLEDSDIDPTACSWFVVDEEGEVRGRFVPAPSGNAIVDEFLWPGALQDHLYEAAALTAMSEQAQRASEALLAIEWVFIAPGRRFGRSAAARSWAEGVAGIPVVEFQRVVFGGEHYTVSEATLTMTQQGGWVSHVSLTREAGEFEDAMCQLRARLGSPPDDLRERLLAIAAASGRSPAQATRDVLAVVNAGELDGAEARLGAVGTVLARALEAEERPEGWRRAALRERQASDARAREERQLQALRRSQRRTNRLGPRPGR